MQKQDNYGPVQHMVLPKYLCIVNSSIALQIPTRVHSTFANTCVADYKQHGCCACFQLCGDMCDGTSGLSRWRLETDIFRNKKKETRKKPHLGALNAFLVGYVLYAEIYEGNFRISRKTEQFDNIDVFVVSLHACLRVGYYQLYGRQTFLIDWFFFVSAWDRGMAWTWNKNQVRSRTWGIIHDNLVLGNLDFYAGINVCD